VVGKLLVPSFIVSAAAPLVYAFVIERLGDAAALYLSTTLAAVILAAAAALVIHFRQSSRTRGERPTDRQ
jgi:hypothetical protein